MWMILIPFFTFIGRSWVTASGIVCGNNVTITLDAADLSNLEVTSRDYIVISKNEVSQPSMITNDRCKTTNNVSSPAVFKLSGMYDCDPYTEVKDEFVYVTWLFRKVVTNDVSQPIIRFKHTRFNRTCRYRLNYLLNSSGEDVAIRKVQFNSSMQDAFLSPVIGFFDDQFVTPQTSVTIPGFINVEIRLNQINESFNNIFSVQVTDCWVNLAEDSEIEPQFPLVDMNCKSKDDPNEDENIIILRNFQPNYARIKYRSFLFSHLPITEPQFHFVHCEIKLCNNDQQPNCTIDQCNRTRRHVSRMERSNEQILNRDLVFMEKKKISHGPIRINLQQNMRTCKSNNGGCSDVCTMIGKDVMCACSGIGETLLDDHTTCAAIETAGKTRKKISHNETPTLVIVVLLLGSATFVAFCLVFTADRRLRNDMHYSGNKL